MGASAITRGLSVVRPLQMRPTLRLAALSLSPHIGAHGGRALRSMQSAKLAKLSKFGACDLDHARADDMASRSPQGS
jgi:hypothetical protein